ncbi:VWA domain-containing protein [Candidatus Bathyarchaeota archaeon]|nr:VWA domain-containing protein [Candidatus Bathyarchaeota archaeon]
MRLKSILLAFFIASLFLSFLTPLPTVFSQEFPHIEAVKTISPVKVNEGDLVTVKITLRGAGGLILTPVDVVLILDRSGSMSGKKIVDAQEAAIAFLNFLDEKDRAALVSYSHTISIGDLTYMSSSNKEKLKNEIKSTKADGRTDIYNAMVAAIQILLRNPREEAPLVSILLTDGLHNWPTLRPDSDFIALAEEAKNHDIIIYTIGLGKDVNESLLKKIASITGGKYYFAASSSELKGIYEEIGGKLSFAGTKIEVSEHIPPYLTYTGEASKPPYSTSTNGETIIVWKIGSLRVGEEWEVTYTAKANKALEYDSETIQCYIQYITAVGASAIINLPPGAVWNDLALTNQIVNPVDIDKGSITQVNVNIENKGLIRKSFKFASFCGELKIYERELALNPGESKLVSFSWNTSNIEAGTYNLTSIVDFGNEVFEVDESNNIGVTQVKIYEQTGSALFIILLIIMVSTITVGGSIGYLKAKKILKQKPKPLKAKAAEPRYLCKACGNPLIYDLKLKEWRCMICGKRYKA